EAGRAGAHAQGDVFLGIAADDAEAHLTARALGLDVGVARGQVLGRLDAVGAGGGRVAAQALLDDLDALHDLDHAHEIPVPAIADFRLRRRDVEGRNRYGEIVGFISAVRLELAQVPVRVAKAAIERAAQHRTGATVAQGQAERQGADLCGTL